MNNYRVTAWNQDDDATKPPPLREETQRSRPIGRYFDPRVAIIKDTPGSLLIEEIGMECTIMRVRYQGNGSPAIFAARSPSMSLT